MHCIYHYVYICIPLTNQPMENKIKAGNIVVLKATEKHPLQSERGRQVAFYVIKGFPIAGFTQLISDGIFTIRKATKEEKEYCYWCYEITNKEGVDLAGMWRWLEYKKNK